MISYFDLFHNVSISDVELLMSKLKPKTFRKGDLIIVPGQVQKDLFFIKSGVQMSYFETDRNIHVVAFTYPPNPCAIPESFSFQTPSTYYLT
ncbi:MAG: Crp/Fnr family transcriptional regulator, partial [Bacteroidota bacterium]|nr:Crp/Fnr family transcriptional regulator [Bacteroidota bacterium]